MSAALLSAPTAAKAESKETSVTAKSQLFGEGIPFGDPLWYQGYASPYYNDSHRAFRAKVRKFVDAELIPYCHEWDESGTYPKDLAEKAYKAGILAAMWPKEYGGTPPEGCDYFHDLILVDELARCGCGGVLWACFFAFGIALPPILKVGTQEMRDLVARDIITGKKIIALAVTEPYAGSDVASLRTTAVREGDFFIVNGLKKFITGGTRADYLTTAVRTGGAGMGGVSLLLIEANLPGIKATRMKTNGWWVSSTALISFDNVKVPVKNLIGKENSGFSAIMENFNHERFVLAATSNRYARVCMEDAIRYARQRVTFGKKLSENPVIRQKVAEMARQVEATQCLLENVAYQMQQKTAERKLASLIALTKVQCTKTFDFCTREATQIFGGSACIRGGPGERVERLYREVRINAIGGGSEEIMLELAMKQSKL
jgi:alkylation response protein AidB-like acyl-CoA dehydrogenase